MSYFKKLIFVNVMDKKMAIYAKMVGITYLTLNCPRL